MSDYQQSYEEIPAIVRNNRDVEHIVYASCRYGHHGFGRKNKDKLFSMLVSTDMHHCPAQLAQTIAYLNYHAPLDCGICIGDILAADFRESADWYAEGVALSQKPFFTALGNHDLGNSPDAALAATTQMSFDKIIRPVADKIGIDGLSVPYYVKHFEQYKISLVVLHSFDTPDELAPDGNYAIHRGVLMHSQAQIDWLIDTLQGIPADHHLLIAMHAYPYRHTVVEGPWSQPGRRLDQTNGLNAYGDTDLLSDIIHAWSKGEACHGRYTPVRDDLPTIAVDCDFSARGEGQFAAYLIGHYHRDILAKNEKYPDQNIIAFVCSAADDWQSYDNDLPRAEGTKAQDALTVCSVDTDKREIRLVRVGSNVTMEMTERTYTVVHY